MNLEMDFSDRWTRYDSVGFSILCTLIIAAIIGALVR